MRIVATLVALSSLALSACSGQIAGPAAPVAQTRLSGNEASIQAGIRATAIAFAEAYASAGQDGGRSMRPLVAGPTLTRWAHWLAVQADQFPGAITGSADVREVGSARAPSLPSIGVDDRSLREVGLVAQVDLRAVPGEGDPLRFTWTLTGPMLLAANTGSRWRVLDFHRDGIPMSAVFQVVEDVELEAGPRLRVRLDSFVAAPIWQFDLVATVADGPPVTLPPRGAWLVDGSGSVVARGHVTSGLDRIEPGRRAEGLATFDPRPDAQGLFLRLVFEPVGPGDGDDVVIEIPLEDAIRPLPVATASPSAPSDD